MLCMLHVFIFFLQTKVSLSRLEDFLFAEDLNPEDVDTNYSGSKQELLICNWTLVYMGDH